MADRELSLILKLKDEATAELKKISKNFGDLEASAQQSSKMVALGLTAVTAAVGAATVAFGIQAVKAAAESQAQMASFGATMDALKGKTIELATGMTQTISTLKLTGPAADDVKNAIQGAQIAIKEKQASLVDLSKQLQTGKITQAEYALQTEKTKNQIDGLKIKISEANQKLGESDSKTIAITKTTKLQAQAVEEAKNAIIKASKASLDLGFSDEEAANAMARFYQRTGDVNKAVDLNNIAMDLARAKHIDLNTAASMVNLTLSGNARMLKQYGIDIKDSATPLEALGQLHDIVKGQAVAFANTYEGKMTILNEKIEEFKESVGAKLLPVLTKMLDGLIKIADKMADWEKILKNVFTELAKHPIILSAIAGALTGALLPALGSFATALWGVAVAAGAAMLTLWPFVLGGALVGGLIAGIILIVKHWDIISAKIVEVWGAITSYLSGVWTAITTKVSEVWNGIKNFFSSIWDGIVNVFKFSAALAVGAVMEFFNLFGIDIIAVFNGIISFFQTAWSIIVALFQLQIAIIQSIWQITWGAIKAFLVPLWSGIKSFLSESWNFIVGLFNTFSKPVSDAWSGLWAGVSNVLTVAMEGMKSLVKGTLNWIIDKINDMINALNSVALKGAGALGLKIPTIPNIPRLAKGGIVTSPTLAMVGEAGPEAVIPLSQGRKGLGGAVNVSVVVNGDVTGTELVEKVKDAIMREVSTNFRFAL